MLSVEFTSNIVFKEKLKNNTLNDPELQGGH
jgi:hypothetical protein